MIGYLDPRERNGCPFGCPYVEARRYFNLLAQLTGMLIGDAVDQIDLQALSGSAGKQALDPSVMKAIKDGIINRIHPEFSRDFSDEMQVLSEVVDGLVQSDFATDLVRERVERDRHERCV